ncbi:hypothetical protein [Mesorhizobium sp. M0802]|uniref:hypothetical protein n=1 Tax=Mesorhizobium sp. M0802 TaxID=2957001 RepID=UPI00333AF61A
MSSISSMILGFVLICWLGDFGVTVTSVWVLPPLKRLNRGCASLRWFEESDVLNDVGKQVLSFAVRGVWIGPEFFEVRLDRDKTRLNRTAPPLTASLRKVDRKDTHLRHLPFLRKRHHGAKQTLHQRQPKGHPPPHQLTYWRFGSSQFTFIGAFVGASVVLGRFGFTSECLFDPY